MSEISEVINLPTSYVLGIITLLGTVISGLAGLLWAVMQSRLKAQDRIIEGLRADVDRMAKGCGLTECHWRLR